jgi:hypothetical protein
MSLDPRQSILVLYALSVAVPSMSLRAQGSIDLAAFLPCKSCALKLRPIAMLGDPSGPGAIDFEAAQVRHSDSTGHFAVFQTGATNILLFDRMGKFLRSVGRSGQGPGEILILTDARFSGPHILVLDAGNQKLLTMDLKGKVVRESKVRVRPGRFRVLSDTSIVIGAMDLSPDLVGYPLHLLRPQTGERIRSFGSKNGKFSAAEPYSDYIHLGWSMDPSSLPWASGARLRIEDWDIDGHQRRIMTGDFKWFIKLSGPNHNGPWSGIVDFGTDAADRLWTMVYVPDARWRDVQTHGTERAILAKDKERFLDTRVDIYDLRDRRHLGSLTWDEAGPGLTQIGRDLALQRIVFDATGVARVVVYQVDFGSAPQDGFQRR